MSKNPIAYYFRSGVVEGLLALAFLLLIPSDPKNSWLLGYSKSRLLLTVPLILLIAFFLLLSNFYAKRPEFAKKLDRLLEIFGLFLPVLLLFFGFAVIGPLLKSYTYLETNEMKTRLLPYILYGFSRFIQLYLVAITSSMTRKKQGIHWRFSRQTLIALFLAITGILVTAHVSLSIIQIATQELKQYRDIWRINRYFNLTYEMNLPAVYSSLLLACAGAVLLVIAYYKLRHRAKFGFQWLGLSLIFFYLAVDELLAIHEDLGYLADERFGKENLVIQDWAYAGIVIVLIFILLYLPFFIHLPPGHKSRFFISAALYMGGFLGVEIIGSVYEIRYGIQDIPYLIFTTTEETLEMVGVIYFIHTLLIYQEDIKAKQKSQD
jgi:hypothetical protein